MSQSCILAAILLSEYTYLQYSGYCMRSSINLYFRSTDVTSSFFVGIQIASCALVFCVTSSIFLSVIFFIRFVNFVCKSSLFHAFKFRPFFWILKYLNHHNADALRFLLAVIYSQSIFQHKTSGLGDINYEYFY